MCSKEQCYIADCGWSELGWEVSTCCSLRSLWQHEISELQNVWQASTAIYYAGSLFLLDLNLNEPYIIFVSMIQTLAGLDDFTMGS